MLRLLIDENFDHRILRGLLGRLPDLDHVIAQQAGLTGTEDPELLEWAAGQNRVLVTHDIQTIPKFAYDRIKSGEPMPGVIAVPKRLPIGDVVTELLIVIECTINDELENTVKFLPL
ncbi:MAG TPA: DUF5615 family PIN-like protein [Blastocatellia bacterium]|nr:DUF5615 family PIN-like protein [Blastocatellia bacterium]